MQHSRFCDIDDQLHDGGGLTGWHSGFPDARHRLLKATERGLPESPEYERHVNDWQLRRYFETI